MKCHIWLYPEDYSEDVWEEYCDICGVSYAAESIKIVFDDDDIEVTYYDEEYDYEEDDDNDEETTEPYHEVVVFNGREYSFDCNISEKDYYNNLGDSEIEIWAAAFLWDENKNVGVEYNFSIDMTMDEPENCSAIYKSCNNDEGNLETDYNEYISYEIDFYEDAWRDELKKAMYEALLEFYPECK